TTILTEEKEQEPYIYNQLNSTLEWINNESELMVPIFMYELKLFKLGGFAPIIDCCARCGDVNNLTSFSVKEGGLICDNSFHTNVYAVQISPNFIKQLTIFMKAGLE